MKSLREFTSVVIMKLSLEQQLTEIKTNAHQLVARHGHDFETESQIDINFYDELDNLAKIAKDSDYEDIEANGYRSALDDVQCLIQVCANH